jgi:C-terminal processing protease CtpA/Prc
MRFTAQLKDGHSNAYPPEALAPRFYARPGLRTARIEGHVLVTEVRDPALMRQGVRIGDEVLRIDGMAVDQYAKTKLAPFQSSSTPQDLELRTYTYMLLAGDERRAVRLDLRHADGVRYPLRAPRSGYNLAPGAANESFEVRADGVAVLKAGQFETDAAANLLEAHIDQLMQARAWVIDLRGNGGGSSNFGWNLLSWLQAGALPTPVSRVREDNAYTQARMGPMAAPQWKRLPDEAFDMHRPRHFSGPVAVLTDAGTFSAAEDTAAAFRLMRRGVIIGTASGGSTGQPLSFPLPGGGSARLCVKRDSYPDGTDFVGIGVQPDIVVAPSVRSLRAGNDPALQAAVDYLLQKAAHD